MRAMLKAGACALVMMAATQAQAYTYLTFEVIGDAYGTKQFYDAAAGPSYPYQVWTGNGFFRLNFTVRMDQYASATSANCAVGVLLFCSATASGNTIRLYEVNEPHHLVDDLDFTLCLHSAATLSLSGSGYLDIDPSCSSGSWRNAHYYYDGDNGTVTSIGLVKYTAFTTSGYLGGSPYDLTVGGAVMFTPEPATWATMLLGFAMSGYALRRRRATLAVA